MDANQLCLRGGCSCGRNRYAIAVPSHAVNQAEVIFSGHQDHRRAQGVPLTAWLRVPLTWFQSQTYAYYPDETRATIRRTFTPLHAPHTQRNFCGYCGTPMTFWTESPREEADFMSVSLGSLFGDDLRLLEDLDLLPGEDATDEGFSDQTTSSAIAPTSSISSPVTSSSNPVVTTTSYRHGTLAGVPWFEEMIEGSRLGRIMRSRRGIGVSGDQSTAFEWEISEWHSSSDTGRQPTTVISSPGGNGKRKADDMVIG